MITPPITSDAVTGNAGWSLGADMMAVVDDELRVGNV